MCQISPLNVSQISPFFWSGKELFSGTHLLKETPRRTKTISPVWKKILKIWGILFELIEMEVQFSKNYWKGFLPQEARAFMNNIEKPRPKLKKYMCCIFTDNICSVCTPMQVIFFCEKCINSVEQRLKFSHFKGSIIP